MIKEDISTNLIKLANFYTKNITPHKYDYESQHVPYNHMGATITDAVLQAGMNYSKVVYPRVKKLLVDYKDYNTTCDFLILMQVHPLDELIQFKNIRKLNLITSLCNLFWAEEVNTEKDLSQWLSIEENKQVLMELNGFGPKTFDYLKMLSGDQSIAIDRHLFVFLRIAEINITDYYEALNLYEELAKYLNITKYKLDKTIWSFMSENKKMKTI